jgi:hypothetical protein
MRMITVKKENSYIWLTDVYIKSDYFKS